MDLRQIEETWSLFGKKSSTYLVKEGKGLLELRDLLGSKAFGRKMRRVQRQRNKNIKGVKCKFDFSENQYNALGM